MLYFPWVLKTVKYPVIGCPEVSHSVGRLREHFMSQYFYLRIAVVQEGKEPLPCCEFCGMHVPAGRIIKHRRMKRCNRNTQMRWQRRDVAISSRCAEASFILTEEDEAECIKGMETFKYLGRLIYWLYDNWPEVRRNVS